MIWSRDVPYLPSGVTLGEGCLMDVVWNEEYPLNATGHQLLCLVDGRRSVGEIAEQVARETGGQEYEVLRDTLAFFTRLNDTLLLNVRAGPSWKRVFFHVISLLLTRSLASAFRLPRERVPLPSPDSSPLIHLGWIGWQVVRRSALLILCGSALLGLLGESLVSLMVIAGSLIGSLVIHEWSHWLTADLLGHRRAILCVSLRAWTVGIGRRILPPLHELLVAVAGPLVTSIIGAFGILLAQSLGIRWLMLGGSICCIHLVSLLPLAQDGRNALDAFGRLRIQARGEHSEAGD